MALKNELIEICPNIAVCPDHVAYVRRVSGKRSCEVVLMTNGSNVLQSQYTYEFTCKLLATNDQLGDGYARWKPKNPAAVDDEG